MVMPRAFSSFSRSVSTPVSARTSEVLPWSMWPAVPTIMARPPQGVRGDFALHQHPGQHVLRLGVACIRCLVVPLQGSGVVLRPAEALKQSGRQVALADRISRLCGRGEPAQPEREVALHAEP